MRNTRKSTTRISYKNPFKFKEGDHVRIHTYGHRFSRHYDNNFTGEIFIVTHRKLVGLKPVYKISDINGGEIEGTFTENEIRKAYYDPEKTWKIESILKTRYRNKRKEALVRWYVSRVFELTE